MEDEPINNPPKPTTNETVSEQEESDDLKAIVNESEALYRTLFESSRDSLMTLSPPSWKFTTGNPATLKMFRAESEEDFLSRPPWEFSPEYQPDGQISLEKAQKMIEIALKEGSVYFEWTHQRLTGEEFPATVLLTRTEIDGEVLVQATVRDRTDITKIKKEKDELQEQYTQAQKMEALGTLAGGIAHDFNNMLCTIIGNLEFAKEDTDQASQTFQDIKEALNAARKAAELTKGILAFSRKQKLQLQPVNLNDIILNFISSLKRIVGDDINIDNQFSNNIGTINADESQIISIVANLVTNSRHAIEYGGTVSIETKNIHFEESTLPICEGSKPGDYVELKISDTGSGIHPDNINKIFEPFFTTKEPGRGTGLGLAMIHGSVLQQGGFTTVESELGKGTVFKLYFPTIQSTLITPKRPQTKEVLRIRDEAIMVVEDDPSVRNVTMRSLRESGYKVFEAENAGIAFLTLEKMKKKGESVDLLLTDIRMPQMSGVELVEMLKDKGYEIEIVFMSGYPQEASYEIEGHTFIQKPFDPKTLRRTIRIVLDSIK